MAVTIPISITRRFKVKASPADSHRLLANVPESVGHFPKVDNLVDMGDNKYRWEMQKIGNDAFSLQVVYACQYSANSADLSVKWVPVPGVGNSQISGQWIIRSRPSGVGSDIELKTSGEINLPLPRLLSAVAKPVVASEFSSLVDTYVKNLTLTLGAA